jgi:hypothetical protein
MNYELLIAILALLGSFFSISLTIYKTRKSNKDAIEHFKHQLKLKINTKLESIKPIKVYTDDIKIEKNSITLNFKQQVNDIFNNLHNILKKMSDNKNLDMKRLREIEIELISIEKKMEPLNDDFNNVKIINNSFTI